MQQFLDSLGFHSLGEKRKRQAYALQRLSVSQTATENELYEYILNSDGVVQVENAIIKPIEETTAEVIWQFLLVMTPQYLSSTTYADLVAGTFDPNTMNQFATNPEDVNFYLFDFISQTPSGYAETIVNPAVASRPMFGSREETWTECGGVYYNAGTGNCVRGCEDHKRTTTYIFWIGFRGADNVTASYEVPAVGC